MRSPPRILFVAEAVTLAHVARPAVLARSLPETDFDIVFASASDRYQSLLKDLPFPRRAIRSISSERFLDTLAHGHPLHDEATLREYVTEDLALLKEVQPDVVVGDLRQSLGVSARLARIPYISIVSAYWSPGAHPRWDMPEHRAVKLLGISAANALFRLVRPVTFSSHAKPLNRVRKSHGLRPVAPDLRATYNDADFVVYPDVPELVPVDPLPQRHTYIGPLIWSPSVTTPAWWHDLPMGSPFIYVTPGSSGAERLLDASIMALASEPVTAIIARAGMQVRAVPANVRVADYLPGDQAAAKSALVICNGGSPTTHQALAAGKPVLGIPSNLDQHLNMHYVEGAGAGISLRSERATPDAIREAVRRLLNEGSFRSNAERIGRAFRSYDAGLRFRAVLGEALSYKPYTA